jgi:hypothetical protein
MLSILKQEKIRGDFFKQTGKHPPQLRYFVLLLLSLVILIAGCASPTVRRPNIQEEASIQLKEKTIVLLRLNVEKDGEPFNPFKRYGSRTYTTFRLKLSNMDEGEDTRYIDNNPIWSIPVVSPSLESRKEGWMYLVLKPGTYYLSFFPPGSKEPSQSDDESPQVSAFRFYVPKGEPIMYVGSLSVSCKWSRGIIGNFIGESSEIVVTDETESAKKIAQASLIKFGQMSTSLMQQYDKLATPFTIDKHVPMGVMTRDTKILATPGLMVRGLSQVFLPTVDVMPGKESDPLAASLELLIETTGLVFGTIKGVVDKGIYQSCLQELEREARKLDTAEILSQTLSNTLPKYGISQLVELDGVDNDNIYKNIAKNGLKSVLLAKILRIGLIEDECWGKIFYVEVAIRVQLNDVVTNTCLSDRVLLYTNPHSFVNIGRTYELPLYETSECRKLKVYCDQEGHKILKDEITKAIQFSVKRFCQDLSLKPL